MSDSAFIILLIWVVVYLGIFGFLDFYKKKYIDKEYEDK